MSASDSAGEGGAGRWGTDGNRARTARRRLDGMVRDEHRERKTRELSLNKADLIYGMRIKVIKEKKKNKKKKGTCRAENTLHPRPMFERKPSRLTRPSLPTAKSEGSSEEELVLLVA